MSDETLTSIFSTILDWHLSTQNFPESIKALSKDLVGATLAVYSTAASKLLPTPAKSHYLFNLRDFARVVQVRVCMRVLAGVQSACFSQLWCCSS